MEDVATVKEVTVKMTLLLLSSSPPFFWVDTLLRTNKNRQLDFMLPYAFTTAMYQALTPYSRGRS